MAFPPLLLTPGEPAGVAPEISAAAWSALRSEADCCFALLGDAEYWQARNPGLPVKNIAAPGEAAACFASALPVLHRPLAAHPQAGHISTKTSPQVIAAIDEAVAMAFAGAVPASSPIRSRRRRSIRPASGTRGTRIIWRISRPSTGIRCRR